MEENIDFKNKYFLTDQAFYLPVDSLSNNERILSVVYEDKYDISYTLENKIKFYQQLKVLLNIYKIAMLGVNINPEQALEKFYHNLTDPSFFQQGNFYYETVKKTLEKIYFLLLNQEDNIKQKYFKIILKDILVCGPGIFTHLQETLYDLMPKNNLVSKLAECRKNILLKLVGAYIHENDIGKNYEIHVAIAFQEISQYFGFAIPLAENINKIKDQFAMREIFSLHHLISVYRKFIKFYCQELLIILKNHEKENLVIFDLIGNFRSIFSSATIEYGIVEFNFNLNADLESFKKLMGLLEPLGDLISVNNYIKYDETQDHLAKFNYIKLVEYFSSDEFYQQYVFSKYFVKAENLLGYFENLMTDCSCESSAYLTEKLVVKLIQFDESFTKLESGNLRNLLLNKISGNRFYIQYLLTVEKYQMAVGLIQLLLSRDKNSEDFSEIMGIILHDDHDILMKLMFASESQMVSDLINFIVNCDGIFERSEILCRVLSAPMHFLNDDGRLSSKQNYFLIFAALNQSKYALVIDWLNYLLRFGESDGYKSLINVLLDEDCLILVKLFYHSRPKFIFSCVSFLISATYAIEKTYANNVEKKQAIFCKILTAPFRYEPNDFDFDEAPTELFDCCVFRYAVLMEFHDLAIRFFDIAYDIGEFENSHTLMKLLRCFITIGDKVLANKLLQNYLKKLYQRQVNFNTFGQGTLSDYLITRGFYLHLNKIQQESLLLENNCENLFNLAVKGDYEGVFWRLETAKLMKDNHKILKELVTARNGFLFSWIAHAGHCKILKLFIEMAKIAGGDELVAKLLCTRQCEALQFAVAKRYRQVTTVLLEAGRELNDDQKTYRALLRKQQEVLEFIYSKHERYSFIEIPNRKPKSSQFLEDDKSHHYKK